MEHNNTNNNMERNFPIIKINWFDKMYKKLVLSLTKKLDNGQIFKTIIVSLLHLLSFAFLFGGIIFCVAALFGDYGYISALKMYPGGKKVLAIIGLIIGLPIGLFMSWFLYSLVRKRAQQLGDNEYKNVLTFVFINTFPALIILIGEIGAALGIMASVLQLFGTLLNSIGLRTNDEISRQVFLLALNMAAHFSGSYEYIGMSLGMEGGVAFMIIGSVLFLIGAYIFRDVYNLLQLYVYIFSSFLKKVCYSSSN